MHMSYRFQIRWKEEVLCHSDFGSLVFDFPMGPGANTVYFPNEKIWEKEAPVWAKDKREEILDALREWCIKNKLDICIEGSHVIETKR